MDGPSKHLSWGELACNDGTPYPEEWRTTRAVQLAEIFEMIRTICGNKSITVLSAFRTPAWNKKVGGAVSSQHLLGKALDLKHTTLTNDEFYKLIRNLPLKATKIRGIGRYTTFVHVDIRDSENVAYWNSLLVKEDTNV
jgi:uncharacterized protein YcbK (DUF882 family)